MDDLRFGNGGLIPAIVQDPSTGSVLMLGWMDRAAVEQTLATRLVHFHSRSRARLWKKGETSGHLLHLVSLSADCDGDALLVRAHPQGPVCHTGAATCWGADPAPALSRFLSELAGTLRSRRRDLPPGSYSATLFREGRSRIAQKVGEEAIELCLAAVGGSRERATDELTDLIYALMVLATELELEPAEIVTSLQTKRDLAGKGRSE
ncbi:MAG: bifunctional phosphoribosyl-AMP cyclohydrolase/phosphoribosyl-ATP diphosphatase HisIE [Candidatus Limnocylindria bacterium]